MAADCQGIRTKCRARAFLFVASVLAPFHLVGARGANATAAPHIAVYKQVLREVSFGAWHTFGANPPADSKVANGVRTETTCPSFCYQITLVNDGTVDLQGVSVTDAAIDITACSFPATIPTGVTVMCVVTGVAVCEDTTN